MSDFQKNKIRYYIKVCEEEKYNETIDIPCEDDGMVLLSTLASRFPSARGLKYRHPEANWQIKDVRLLDGRLYSPDEGWNNFTYFISKNVTMDNKKMIKKKIIINKTAKIKSLVKNLPLIYNWTNIKEYFELFGFDNIKFMNLVKDKLTNKSTGTCIVGFINAIENENFIRCMNGKEIEVRVGNDPYNGNYELSPVRKMTLQVGLAKKKPKNYLNIRNIPQSITSVELTELLLPYGRLAKKVEIPLWEGSPFSKGFALVCFETDEQAEAAIKGLNGMEIVEDSNKFIVQSSNAAKNTVYIGNISRGMSDQELNSIFSQFGTIVKPIIVNRKNDDRSLSTSVEYSTEIAAAAAIEAMTRNKYHIVNEATSAIDIMESYRKIHLSSTAGGVDEIKNGGGGKCPTDDERPSSTKKIRV